jgi:hypothetical protein
MTNPEGDPQMNLYKLDRPFGELDDATQEAL